ncbi:T9SS type A sorting domain-containing protein [Winogradskyella psychrotolerans]|uniref:T9SS type A sorting domain-containing protein n=1 Tax=Winogradskyella psychrotolerans TaxID=1344585 RepID=UPI001C064C95|nr:T9SS type A sorting domain-containing protein [Winogradskyella psychrotolerans]MBU2920606.1 T9SS type A sorting domain-containing protein [Winogradskyella psychrotolerans]
MNDVNPILLEIGGIGLDENENIYISGVTSDNSGYFGSSDAVYQSQNPGELSNFISKFDTVGNRIWSTYFGGTSTDIGINLRLYNGFLYMAGYTYNQGLSIGSTVYQTQRLGISDDFLLKMDLDGQPVWTTYFGGSGISGIRSYVSFGDDDSIWLTGLTDETEGIASSNAYQTELNLGNNTTNSDVYFAKFNDLGQLDFVSYYGGEGEEVNRAKTVLSTNNEFYIVGTTQSEQGIATIDALQESVITENPEDNYSTMFVAKFYPRALGNEDLNNNHYNIWPNLSTGSVTLSSANDEFFNLRCFDLQGRLVKRMDHILTNKVIDLNNISAGVYFLEVTSPSRNKHVFKVIFE